MADDEDDDPVALPGNDSEQWRDVDDEVGLSDEPWWETAEAVDQEAPPGHPDDERWHETGDDAAGRPVDGLPDVEAPDESGWLPSLDRAQRLAIFGIAGLAVLFALLSVTYVWVLTGASGPQVDAPQASFEGAYDADSGELTLRHASGEAVAADRLAVTVDGQRHADWSAGDDALTVGDEIVIQGVPQGSSGELQWLDADGDLAAPIATFEATA